MKFTATLFIDNQFNGIQFAPGVLKSTIEEYSQSSINFGELGRQSSSIVNLRNISHSIENIRFEENRVVADFNTLETPAGKLVEELIKNQFTANPRILGIVKDNQISWAEILSFDIDL